MNDFVYDIETYKNLFSCCTVHVQSGRQWIHEVSDRKDGSLEFSNFIRKLRMIPNVRMVGFNNEAFDYPVIHYMVLRNQFTAIDAYNIAQNLIQGDKDTKFRMMVWPNKRLIPQVDLFKIHHFDNKARSTSLKALEIAMKSKSVIDLPYDPHTDLTPSQMDEIIAYMCHDVSETVKFYHKSRENMDFRSALTERFGFDSTNFNDTKIGKEYFTIKLEEAQPGITGMRSRPRRPKQTHREKIDLNEVILPVVQFNNPEFQGVLNFLRLSKISETKGFFDKLHCVVNGFRFDFGTGGIHGSVNNQAFIADDQFDIIDVDVASYYPNIAIANRLYPEHLGETFCEIYSDVYEMRKGYKKGSPENAMLKLALNGVYGDSNNIYSCFYDPQYTMAITVNGQLMLCMLAEWIMSLPGVDLIQINTDGLTAKVHKSQREKFMMCCRYWEKKTGLELEDADYSRMWIRDVNNYVAESKGNGKVKLKGAYDYNKAWHQDNSSLVIPKAVEAYLTKGITIEDFIKNHPDEFDFCRRVKVPRSGRLELSTGEVIQNITRYHISFIGPELIKVLPPLKGKQHERRGGIDVNQSVTVCNDMDNFNWDNLYYDWYIEQAEQLVEACGG